MKAGTAKRLHDAIGACDEISGFVSEWSREEFLSTRGYQLIVWKLTEIVGEALRQGEEQEPMLRTLIPELREVINTRNRIVHGYDSVDFELLWDIATNEVPPLRNRMATLLKDAPSAEG
jgi:uncharacterized protein with HEPN domain